MYLPPAAVPALVAAVARLAAPGSTLLATVVNEAVIKVG